MICTLIKILKTVSMLDKELKIMSDSNNNMYVVLLSIYKKSSKKPKFIGQLFQLVYSLF